MPNDWLTHDTLGLVESSPCVKKESINMWKSQREKNNGLAINKLVISAGLLQ